MCDFLFFVLQIWAFGRMFVSILRMIREWTNGVSARSERIHKIFIIFHKIALQKRMSNIGGFHWIGNIRFDKLMINWLSEVERGNILNQAHVKCRKCAFAFEIINSHRKSSYTDNERITHTISFHVEIGETIFLEFRKFHCGCHMETTVQEIS